MSSIGKKGGIQNFIFKKGIYVANFLRLINIFLFVIDLRKMKNTFLDVF